MDITIAAKEYADEMRASGVTHKDFHNHFEQVIPPCSLCGGTEYHAIYEDASRRKVCGDCKQTMFAYILECELTETKGDTGA